MPGVHCTPPHPYQVASIFSMKEICRAVHSAHSVVIWGNILSMDAICDYVIPVNLI